MQSAPQIVVDGLGIVGIIFLMVIYGYVARILKVSKEILQELKKK